ncbi:MAG: GAF domain-containing protein [Chloroflexi bacterium]|nr:GAF domain-containing protein [Chloroflexota bacterium]
MTAPSSSVDMNLSWGERLRFFLQKLVAPHPSIPDEGKQRRAQLLCSLSLIVLSLTIAGGIATKNEIYPFEILAGVSLLSYLLGRTKYFNLGAYLFSYSLAGFAFMRIYLGTASTVESAISTSVYVALVLAGALLSQQSFFLFVVATTVATFAVPLYSNVTQNFFDNVTRTGGVVLSVGILLFGVNVYLSSLEQSRLKKLQNMNVELDEVRKTLESRVESRTAELQEINSEIVSRAARLQGLSRVSLTIAESIDQRLQDLLSQTTKAISDTTGYYHVGIFQLDENREFAVLRAANSTGGQRMLERRHQLRVGGTGIVGYVTQSGRTRIALDTGADAVFFNNPDLPRTRSEMAIPLKIGLQVIGALDIQSTQPSAFREEEVAALTTLANQIALIVQNANLNQGDSDSPSAGLGRGRLRIDPGGKTPGFTYMPDGSIVAAAEFDSEIIRKSLETGEPAIREQLASGASPSIAMPVKLRDQLIGMIHVEAADPSRKWTEDEISILQAVSDRAALALENASLFEAAERRANLERAIAEMSDRIGESNDVERILQTSIQELGRTMGATRTFIQIGTLPSASSESGRYDNGEEADPK